MNPIGFALRRPWTVLVLAIALVLGAGLAAWRMRVDIFPNLNLPVIYVCQPYGGMDPAQMEGLLTNYYEYHFLYINGIHHVESRNIQGMALMKLVFHPGTNMAQAMGETIAYVTRSRAFMPPGTVSPFVTRFDAGGVPVGYLVLSSETRTVAEIQDQALFKVRPMFAALPGVSAPPPFGGAQRTLVARLDPERLRATGTAPDDVLKALESGNVISPSGSVRIGEKMPIVPINSLVRDASELLDLPIRPGQAPTVYLRDVATVHDAADIPVGFALVNGRRAVYILVTKRADASTLDVVRNVRAAIPSMQAVLPDDIRVRFEFDQSPTVLGAVSNLAAEAALGAALIGLVVLLFLRDWRTVLIVVLNIPLALAGALTALWLTGQSVNLMTLGGLALAVGILVDESTVELENIHARLRSAGSVALAVRQGNLDTAGPRLLAMLCVLAVFAPSFFMTDAARALFVPLALAVGFAMVASYLLSSTLVPVLGVWLLRSRPGPDETRSSALANRLRLAFGAISAGLTRRRWLVAAGYALVCSLVILGAGRGLPVEIFPQADAGRFQLRFRAESGTRVEKTEEIAREVLEEIGREAGAGAVELSVGYVGLIPSTYPINAIYQWSGGPEEAFFRVELKRGSGVDIPSLKARLRASLAARFPGVRFSFEPADIVSDVMSFGSPTPIEVAVAGPNFAETREYAARLHERLAELPELRDLRYAQNLDYPTINVKVDRTRAGLSGLTMDGIARSLVTATSSSRFVLPSYWPDPKSGIGYQVQVEIPFARTGSISDIESIPLTREQGPPLLLRDVAEVQPSAMPGEYDRYNMKRMVSLTANLSGRDLGAAAGAVEAAISRTGEPPKGATVDLRGQVVPLREILRGLGFGLVLAVVAILLLLTANFQSLRLALVALATVPAVLAGVALALRLTNTTVNLQSFNGAIMAIGVAVANAILLVTFAERSRRAGATAHAAAIEGALGRLRPISMTALAMIAGMLPMALGLGEAGGQSAPLGRAVVGGLLAGTLAALLVLPAIFSLAQGRVSRASPSLDPFDPQSRFYLGDAEVAASPGASTGNGHEPSRLARMTEDA